MTRNYDMEVLSILIEKAIDKAKSVKLDHHFISELMHLKATVEANKELGGEGAK